MNNLKVVLESGIMVRYFDLAGEGKKIKMKKAWNIYKARVGKECNLDNFKEFMNCNKELMPEEMWRVFWKWEGG
ncbi:hypothetical protein SUGI_0740940 [Cryptomeria japonica]|nr:hypothetical protein SUGI_0740940 [Cryptomeria japonica]